MNNLILRAAATLQSFASNTRGATAIEYGLIAAGVAVAIMVTIFTLGDEINNLFGGVTDQLNTRDGG